MDKFGNRLKKIRDRRKSKDPKWTQEYVADLIGVARPTYTAYENGTKQPPLETVTKIADLFDINVDYLLGRSDNPISPQVLVQDYSPFLNAIKEKYPGVDINDPEVQRKLMKAVDLVLEDYLGRQKRRQ